MDPVTIALLGLNLAKTGADYHFNKQAQKSQAKLGKAQYGAAIRGAERGAAQLEEDMGRRRRRLEEELAGTGLEDYTVHKNELAYYDRSADRAKSGAHDRLDLAHKGLDAFNRQLRRQKLQGYLNLGLGAANALGSAWMYSQLAPKAPYDPWVAAPNIPHP